MGIMAPHEGREWKMADYPENIVSAIGVALTTDQLTEFESKINSLPVKYRDALLLHYRDGLTYQRIADENGFVSPSAAWACVRTGLGRLRRMYGAKMGRKETASTPSAPSTPEEGPVSKEQISHEMAVARNDRDVQVGEDGKGWFQGFAAPKASEFFGGSEPVGKGGAEAPACVDNMDGGRPV